MKKKHIFWGLHSSRIIIVLGCSLLWPSIAAAKIDDSAREKNTSGFRVEADAHGKYWFVAPSGEKFLSIGINHIYAKPRPDDIKPGTDYYDAVEKQFKGDFEKWSDDVFRLIDEAGFNTIGAWSDSRLHQSQSIYSTICLYVAGFAWERTLDGFLPDFEQKIRNNIKEDVQRIKDRENIFGIFLDNEMYWYGESPWTIVPNYTLLERALYSEIDPYYKNKSPYNEIAIGFLKDRYKTPQDFSKAWGQTINSWDDLTFELARKCMNNKTQADREEFTALAAEKFYSKTTKVVRQMLPGKLILGTRFAQRAPKGVVEACGRYCDVISFNDYRSSPKVNSHLLAEYYLWSGQKPLMVTEFSWRAEENSSGNPNTKGAGTVVKTQADRAAHYSAYVEDLVAYPMVIGAHWFEFADQSPQGRGNGGEDSNYGIVDIKHRPYTELLRAMGKTNKAVADIHADSEIQPFTELLTPSRITFEPGQRPERPAYIDLLAEEPILPPSVFNADDAGVWIDRKTDPIILKYNTGQSWGCGVILYGPKKYTTSKGANHTTDLDGYSRLVIDAMIPDGLRFDLIVDESGVGPAYQEVFSTDAGDDGESFILNGIIGRKGRFQYEIELKNLKIRQSWGNQRGQRRINMNALRGVALLFHGNQGQGEIGLYALKLVR